MVRKTGRRFLAYQDHAHAEGRGIAEMKKLAVVVALLTLGVVVLVATAFGATKPKLLGTDGPGFTISLKAKGKNVTKLSKGKYTLTVNDKSSIHNFVIEGPGVEKDVTTVSGTGTKTIT